MMPNIQSVYGLKWNPFCPDIPTEAIFVGPRLDHFGGRLEHQVREGGFALITGDPGCGKSVALRYLAQRLGGLRDVSVGVLTHPQSGVGDFYRELSHLFGTGFSAHNRWGGFKALREKWQAHIAATLSRPVLLIDEAQQMLPAVLSELRLLGSTDFDSRALLTVVLAGDARLTDKLASEELLPLGSRIRCRLRLEHQSPAQLLDTLRHALDQAGSPRLMTPDLMSTLSEHAAGNPRVLFTMAAELLSEAARRDVKQLDEKLYLEVFAVAANPSVKTPARSNKHR